MSEAKPAPDWERIEQDYRSGLLSLREIASPYKVTEGAIRKRAKANGWVRDLTAKIQAKADELVRKEEVRTEYASGGVRVPEGEKATIDVGGQVLATVRLSQRKDIRRFRSLADKLLGELEASTDNAELFEQLGEMLRKEDDKGADRMNDLYHKVISLPGRVDSLKKLSEVLRILIDKEREAYGMKAAGDSGTPGDDAPSGLSDVDRANRVAYILAQGQARAKAAG